MDYIVKKLKDKQVPFFANDNIADHIDEQDLKTIRKNVHKAIEDLLDALVIDRKNDHNTQETAKRLTKMYVDEIFAGRYIKKTKNNYIS